MRQVLLALTAALMLAVPAASRQRHAHVTRRVDFRNFTFRTGDDLIRVRRGQGTYRTTDGVEFTYEVERVQAAYGDLTGDGREEAVVVLHYNGGGTGYFSKGFIFDGSKRRLTLLTTFEGGDRADGGIREVNIRDGLLRVQRNEPERMNNVPVGLCCPLYLLTKTYRWDGRGLIQVGETQKVEVDEN